MNQARVHRQLVKWDRYDRRQFALSENRRIGRAHGRLLSRDVRYRIYRIWQAWEREHGPDWIEHVVWNAEDVALRSDEDFKEGLSQMQAGQTSPVDPDKLLEAL